MSLEPAPPLSIKVDKKGRCSLAFQSLRQIPFSMLTKFAPSIKELDMSHNCITDIGQQIEMLVNLESLVVDHNRLQAQIKVAKLPKLKLFWCNSNNVKNLSVFIEKIAEGMLKNDACPNFFNGGTVEQYEDYRMFVLSRLQNLQVLDSTQVTDEERKKAKEVYGNLSMKPMVKQKEDAELKKRQAELQKQQDEALERKKKEAEELERLKKMELEEKAKLSQQKKNAKSNSIPSTILPDPTATNNKPAQQNQAPPPLPPVKPPSALPPQVVLPVPKQANSDEAPMVIPTPFLLAKKQAEKRPPPSDDEESDDDD